RELGRGGWWAYIRKEMKRLRAELPALPAKPPRRQDFEYMRERYLVTDDAMARSLELHTATAVAQAREAGNLDPDGGGSFTHPEITRSLYGDGKAIKAIYRAKPGTTTVDRKTGEVRAVRFDPDAALHTQGGGKKVWGTKVA